MSLSRMWEIVVWKASLGAKIVCRCGGHCLLTGESLRTTAMFMFDKGSRRRQRCAEHQCCRDNALKRSSKSHLCSDTGLLSPGWWISLSKEWALTLVSPERRDNRWVKKKKNFWRVGWREKFENLLSTSLLSTRSTKTESRQTEWQTLQTQKTRNVEAQSIVHYYVQLLPLE